MDDTSKKNFKILNAFVKEVRGLFTKSDDRLAACEAKITAQGQEIQQLRTQMYTLIANRSDGSATEG